MRAEAASSPARAVRASVALILGLLLLLAAAAWLLTARRMGDGSMGMGLAPLAGTGEAMEGHVPATDAMALPVFLAMWVTMMAAMMFPSVAPMVVAHWRIASRRNESPLSAPTFVTGYLLSWSALGGLAYLAYRGILSLVPHVEGRVAALLGGLVLVGAGLYQLTPLKSACLTRCRNPMEFLLHWRKGLRGAARMGVEHGISCVGCCWGLMLVLFVVGLANLAWMGVLAALIFVEKLLPRGSLVARGAGAALIAFGAAAALWPGVLL